MTYRGGAGEAVLWIVVDVVLIVYIAKGSRVATAIPLVLNVFFLATYVTFGLGPDGIRMVDAVPLLVVAAQSIVLVLLLRRARAVRAAPAAARRRRGASGPSASGRRAPDGGRRAASAPPAAARGRRHASRGRRPTAPRSRRRAA